MSNKSERQVALTSYSIKKQESLETYLHEWQTIRQSRPTVNNDAEDEIQEKDDQEAIWLEKLGFGNYVSQIQTGDGNEVTDDAVLKNAGLSKHYAHAIRRRMDTLRSTVKSRKRMDAKERRAEYSRGGGSGGGSGGDSGHSSITNGVSLTLTGSQSSNSGQVATPTSSPRDSPVTSRRSPTSYSITSSEHHSKRNRNGHNIDSGVYSANSSQDGTPVRNQQPVTEGSPSIQQPPGGHSEMNIRGRVKVPTYTSPKHRSEQNGGPVRRCSAIEKGEGVYLDDHVCHHKSDSLQVVNIDPASTSSSSSPVLPRKRQIHSTNNPHSDDNIIVIKRSSSELHTSPYKNKISEKFGVGKSGDDSKTLSHGGTHMRSLSPSSQTGRESSTSSPVNSPEDVKLHFGNVSPNNTTGPDGMQELPTFMIAPDPLGITTINDLSQQDMEKVRSVALLELTVTFDDHDISLRSRRPARTKNYYPENSLCGVPLNVLLQVDQKREPKATIPLIFEAIISHLEKRALDSEGLLRVPGLVTRVQSLLQDLEYSFHLGQFSFSGLKSNDICSLLKQLIRELPVPLLTREYLPAFASIAEISDLKEQVRTLNLLVLLLPDVHQKVLKRLLEFCVNITEQSSVNKMDLTNVAMVIAPNLFITLPTRQTLDDVTMAGKTSHVVRLLIKYHSVLWTIPGEMLRQIRYLYENEVRRLNPRTVQKAIRQMQHQQPNRDTTTNEVSHHIVRVKAPLFTRVCMAVDICVGVTAGDIISKLQKKSRLNKDVIRKRFSYNSTESWTRAESPDDNSNRLRVPEEMGNAGEQFLFECGGNIGERCLPNDTDMYTLYAVNPNAQWVIKPRGCPDLN